MLEILFIIVIGSIFSIWFAYFLGLDIHYVIQFVTTDPQMIFLSKTIFFLLIIIGFISVIRGRRY